METRHDRVGAPLMQLDSGSWIGAIPLTVYHAERFVWETAPVGPDPARLGWEDRCAPNLMSVPDESPWARGLTVSEFMMVAHWLGGRLPVRAEWEQANALWQSSDYLSRLRVDSSGDSRVAALVQRVLDAKVTRRSDALPPHFQEMITEYRRAPHGMVSVVSANRSRGVLPAPTVETYRDRHVGVTLVFDVVGTGGAATGTLGRR